MTWLVLDGAVLRSHAACPHGRELHVRVRSLTVYCLENTTGRASTTRAPHRAGETKPSPQAADLRLKLRSDPWADLGLLAVRSRLTVTLNRPKVKLNGSGGVRFAGQVHLRGPIWVCGFRRAGESGSPHLVPIRRGIWPDFRGGLRGLRPRGRGDPPARRGHRVAGTSVAEAEAVTVQPTRLERGS